MYDLVKAVKEAAILSESHLGAPRYSSLTFIEPLGQAWVMSKLVNPSRKPKGLICLQAHYLN